MDTRHQELYLAQSKSNMDSVDRTTLFMLEITSISNRRKDKVLKNAEIKVQGAKNKPLMYKTPRYHYFARLRDFWECISVILDVYVS